MDIKGRKEESEWQIVRTLSTELHSRINTCVGTIQLGCVCGLRFSSTACERRGQTRAVVQSVALLFEGLQSVAYSVHMHVFVCLSMPFSELRRFQMLRPFHVAGSSGWSPWQRSLTCWGYFSDNPCFRRHICLRTECACSESACVFRLYSARVNDSIWCRKGSPL